MKGKSVGNHSPTGRMSAKGPNIQNIPIHTKEGAALRAMIFKTTTTKLEELIRQDPHTMSLTVAIMALRDLEKGDILSAVARLRVDLDKIRMTNPQLNEYVENLKKQQI